MAKNIESGLKVKTPTERTQKRGFRHQTEAKKLELASRWLSMGSQGLRYWTAMDYISKTNPSLYKSKFS